MFKFLQRIILNNNEIDTNNVCRSHTQPSDKINNNIRDSSFSSFNDFRKMLKIPKDRSTVQPESNDSESKKILDNTLPLSNNSSVNEFNPKLVQLSRDFNPESEARNDLLSLNPSTNNVYFTSTKLLYRNNTRRGAIRHSIPIICQDHIQIGESNGNSNAITDGCNKALLATQAETEEKKSPVILSLKNFTHKKRLYLINELSNHSNISSEYSFYNKQLLLIANIDNKPQSLSEDTNEINIPATSGLGNCNRIIPDYYLLNKLKPGELFKIDYYDIIKDDIKNMRPLSSYHIQYIKDLSDEQKQEIIELFNASMLALINSFSNYNSKHSSPICSMRISKSTKNG